MPNDPSRRNIRRRDISSDPTVSIPKITPEMVERARQQAGAQPAAKPWERDRLVAQQAAQGLRRNRRSDARPLSSVKVIDTTIMPPVQAPAAEPDADSGPSVAELSARAVREVQAARAREAAQAAAPAQPAQPTQPIRRADAAGGTTAFARPSAPAVRERSLEASSMTAEFSAAAVQAGLRQQPAAPAQPTPAARERSLQASSMTAEFSTAAVLEGLRSRQASIPNEPTMPAPPTYPTARPMPHAPTHAVQSRRQFTGPRPVAPPPEPARQTPQERPQPAPERPAPRPATQPVSRPAPQPTAAAVRTAPAAPPVRPAMPAAPAAQRRRSGPTRAQAEAALYRSIHDDHLWLNNPVMVRGLGLAPVVVAAVNGRSALLLCAAAALLLTATRVLAVALCHLSGHKQRPLFYALSAAVVYIPAYAILYAIFGSELSLLGIYLPLLVVDPAIIKRMEAPELESLGEAFSRGINNTLGLCVALMLTGTLRELLSAGSVFGLPLMADPPLPLAAQPAGGFLFVGLLAGLWTAVGGAYVHYKREEVRELYGES